MEQRAVILPELVDGEGLVLRRWLVSDTELLEQAVRESSDHLRPWMEWIAQEPLSLEQRRAMLLRWEREWARGGDVTLGVFKDGQLAGSCGLHRRISAGGLEIGYWIHPAFTRQGLATKAARLLTDVAFSVDGITHVEIHHDKANTVSAGVPRKLGFTIIGEKPDEIAAPAEVGIECVWRMQRDRWQAQRPSTPTP